MALLGDQKNTCTCTGIVGSYKVILIASQRFKRPSEVYDSFDLRH